MRQIAADTDSWKQRNPLPLCIIHENSLYLSRNTIGHAKGRCGALPSVFPRSYSLAAPHPFAVDLVFDGEVFSDLHHPQTSLESARKSFFKFDDQNQI